ncbi:TetR/AcrR family transcriptional regulator [Listeria portnoyi]|uniref:TetR/AcrR family transcriptional regulator n=1 Tax=Listeria portnoyi TaxID=2713504 RepID=UPI001FE65C87|nr:TetR/AcrR family transcriptional regulator [Listeria portnoyi]
MDLRVQKTQTKLYSAVAALFYQNGTSDSITVQELCTQTGVSRATFYRHHEKMVQIIELQVLRKMQEFSIAFDQTN